MACYSIGDICSKGCIRWLSISSKEHPKSPKVGEIHVGRPAGGYVCAFSQKTSDQNSYKLNPSVFSVLFAENLVHWI